MARGTAATRLFKADAELREIAILMGCSIKHAAEVIECYIALSLQMTDEPAMNMKQAEARTKLQTVVQTG